MNHRIIAPIILTQLMNLGMAIVTAGDTIIGAGGLDLLIFQFSEFQALFLETGLQKTTATPAAVIIGSVGLHINEVFFAHHGFDNKTQIFRYRIAVCFANDLAGILNGELDFEVLVPVGIDFKFSLTDPFGIIFVNVFNDKVVFEVEFFQSCQD